MMPPLSRVQRRDRASGLGFNWRLPVSNTAALVVSFLLVGLLSVGLAALVKIRIGEGEPYARERGSVVLVQGVDSLERWAVAQGPFPARWNPAADPAYAELRTRALRQAAAQGVPYEPVLTEAAPRRDSIPDLEDVHSGVLPPLPEVTMPQAPESAREEVLGIKQLQAFDRLKLQLAGLPLEAKETVPASGKRYLIGHDAQGLVVEVTAMSSDGQDPKILDWLRRARVEGAKSAGWLVVETMIER